MSTIQLLRDQKKMILERIAQLGDMRRGSVVEQFMEGKLRDGQRVRRGPYHLYSYKDKGKTVSRRVMSAEELERYEAEIGEFRRFEQLSSELVAVSHEICETKVLGEPEDRAEKKLRRRSSMRLKPKLSV